MQTQTQTLSSDTKGFLTGAPANDLMKKLVEGQDKEVEVLKAMRKDQRTLNDIVKSQTQQMYHGPVGDPAKRKAAQPAAKVSVATSAPAKRAASPHPAPSKAKAPATRPGAVPRRDKATGRFVSAKPSRMQTVVDWFKATAEKAHKAYQEGADARKSSYSFRKEAAKEVLGQVAAVNVGAGVAREAIGVAKPAVDLVRGDPAARREKREEKKADARQKSSEKWYEKIWKAVGGKVGVPAAGGGIKSIIGAIVGVASAIIVPLFTVVAPLVAIATILEKIFGGRDKSDGAPGKPSHRDGGRKAGVLIGGLLGTLIGRGPLGAALGAGAGAWFGDKAGAFVDRHPKLGAFLDHQAVMPSKAPSKNWVWKRKPDISRGMYKKGSAIDKIARIESGGDYGADTQRRAFLLGNGGSSASGKYQFTDSTWADVIATNGAGDPALAGLAPLAKKYMADNRSIKVKAKDPRYAPLMAAKLMPRPTEAAMRIHMRMDKAALASAGITNPTDAQLYATHLSGNVALAKAMGSDSGAALGRFFTPEAISKNSGLLGNIKTVGDLKAKLDSRFGTPAIPSLSSISSIGAPPSISAAPDISIPMLLSRTDRKTQIVAVPVPDVGQNLPDRGIAHAATGGIGMR